MGDNQNNSFDRRVLTSICFVLTQFVIHNGASAMLKIYQLISIAVRARMAK